MPHDKPNVIARLALDRVVTEQLFSSINESVESWSAFSVSILHSTGFSLAETRL